MFYAGENGDFGVEPLEGGYGYGIYNRHSEDFGGRGLFVHESGSHQLWWSQEIKKWLVGYEESRLSADRTTFGVLRSDKNTRCPATIGFDWEFFGDGKWDDAGDKFGIKCHDPDPEQEGDSPRALKSFVSELTDKLHAASTFLDTGKERLKCAPNAHNQLREAGQIVANLKNVLSSRSAPTARFKRQQMLPKLRDFYIESFKDVAFDEEGRFAADCASEPTDVNCKTLQVLGATTLGARELDRMCKKGYKKPTKSCLLEWGSQYVNNLEEDHYLSLITGVKDPEDCMEPCR